MLSSPAHGAALTASQGAELPRPLRKDAPKEAKVLIVNPPMRPGDSDKVEGTAVYGSDRSKVGSIERLMINKTSSQVDYAVLSFGGFLGMGNDYYPIPWQALKYDTELGGYLTNVTAEQLTGAPKFGRDSTYRWSDPTKTRSVDDYYAKSIW